MAAPVRRPRSQAPIVGDEALADLLESAAAIAFTADDVDDVLRWAVEHVCALTGWPVGHVLLVDPQDGSLVSSNVWHLGDPDAYADFVQQSNAIRFMAGEGLPGRVVESGRPTWIVDVRDDTNFQRHDSAMACGLAAAFAFPIVTSSGVDGVMEFFATASVEPHDLFLRLVSNVGITAGHVVEQVRARARVAASEADLLDQRRILERIARGESLAIVLDDLCRVFESRHPGARCSILRIDPADRVLRHAAGPSLPEEYQRAIDGLAVAEGSGACGTAAARDDVVVVADTRTDPLTAAFVDIADRFSLRSIWSTPLHDLTGAVTGTFAIYRTEPYRPERDELATVEVARHLAEIAIERQRAEQALTDAARVDALTGLANRAQFLDRVTRHLRQPESTVGVLVLDIDRFKWINDSLGHAVGDRVLVCAADRLREVVPESGLLSRFGGDEFLILLTDTTADEIEKVATEVEAAFGQPFDVDGGEFFLSVSTGIAISGDERDAIELVRDADAAMFAAKESGRARHAVFDQHLRDRAVTRVNVEADLRRAIERRTITLHYQPIVDLVGGRWTGVEALARWPHPDRGLIAPDGFIPLAEETGLIVPLGLQMLDLAIAQAADLDRAGETVTVAANMSVVQLADPAIADQVAICLERHDVAPARLVIEVTETAVMQQFDVVRDALVRITGLGVQVVIDDFGTGYSSIARLGDLPVAGLKIDKSFTTKLTVEPRMPAVFAAITDLAHALDLPVVAEGIETQAMCDLVVELGCEYGQGFLFARPTPVDTLAELLARPPLP